MKLRSAVVVALFAAGCHHAKSSTPAAPPPGDAAPPHADATCRPLTTNDGTDPKALGLEVCTSPAAGDTVTVAIRRASDHSVLWSDDGDGLGNAHIFGDSDPPSLQISIIRHDDAITNDDGSPVEQYEIIDLEFDGGAVREVNRFMDSGD